MKDFPEYSLEARGVLDLFVMDSVSTIFYFEDEAHESVYERLLETLIPNLRKFAVVCLGGKSHLITRAKESRAHNCTSIFIADKDFDDLLGLIENIDGLYYMERHCLENYLLDIESLKRICVEEDPTNLTRDKADRLLNDSDTFMGRLSVVYENITRLFLVARKFRIQRMETTKMSIDNLLSGADPMFPVPTAEWCAEYRRLLKQNCHEKGSEWLDDDVQLDMQLQDAFKPVKGVPIADGVSDHMNGKHMFRCLVRYVQSRMSVNIESMDTQKLYLRMLSQLDLEAMRPMRDKIVSDFPAILRPS